MEKMTAAEFQRKYGHGNIGYQTQVPRPKLERPARHDTLETAFPKEADRPRFFVRIVSHRKRLLDEDNLAGKYHCDLLRYSGIIPSDDPGTVKIENSQIKVQTKEEEHTEIIVKSLW